MTPEEVERLALALEEAAARVRMSPPTGQVEVEIVDDVERIVVGDHLGSVIPGPRSPLVRSFRITWS